MICRLTSWNWIFVLEIYKKFSVEREISQFTNNSTKHTSGISWYMYKFLIPCSEISTGKEKPGKTITKI